MIKAITQNIVTGITLIYEINRYLSRKEENFGLLLITLIWFPNQIYLISILCYLLSNQLKFTAEIFTIIYLLSTVILDPIFSLESVILIRDKTKESDILENGILQVIIYADLDFIIYCFKFHFWFTVILYV